MGTDTVKRWRREGMPGGKEYNLAEIVAWLRAGPWRQRTPITLAVGSAEQRVTPLDRERIAKAKKAEFEIERLQGVWLAREQVHQVYAAIAQSIRSAGELLERHHGRDAQKILNDALDEARAKIDALAAPLGDDSPIDD